MTPGLYVKHIKWMERDKVFYLEDTINEDRSHTRPWKEVARTHGIKGDRVWFIAVCPAVSEFPQIEVNRVEERKKENQGHACETQQDAEEEKGLVPKALATEWARIFKEMLSSIVEHVSRLFCKFIEKEGREKIWKPRCKRTVEWEKQQGIRETDAQTPRGTAENDTLAADRAVIVAIQRRKRMDIMEKRGAMIVKEFETEDT
ncbi:hypothetical protein K457DRAFT_25738 [Linnemannia elongata AG-77]|uniref:Uncharacterized protein n=1 Tax=Linnemannia elongata AG-77 TaxID=1314771 RepID=A0A197JCQ5_9FUNG|nr:hypothetical protein K457DRAFT_25738 [Linnemannia elongata AG-77]